VAIFDAFGYPTGLLSFTPCLILQCVCNSGFVGKRCEENLNDCKNNECSPNADCVDGIAKYTCNCLAGIHGEKMRKSIFTIQSFAPFDRNFPCQTLKIRNVSLVLMGS
jgi:hypothetical protein